MPFPATLGDAIRGMRGTQGQSRGPFGGRVSPEGQGGFVSVARPTPATPPTPRPAAAPAGGAAVALPGIAEALRQVRSAPRSVGGAAPGPAITRRAPAPSISRAAPPPPPPPEPGAAGPQFLGPGGGMDFGPVNVRAQNTGGRPRARMETMLAMLRGRPGGGGIF